MTDDDIDMAAADYVLGVASTSERAAAQSRLASDPDFAVAVAAWEKRLAPLSAGFGAVEAPPNAFPRIEVLLPRVPAGPTSPAAIQTRPASARTWRTIGPGLAVSMLMHNKAAGRQTLLLRCDPGAIYPEHDHDGDEELFVLEGDLVMGDLTLVAGDYHFAPKGQPHPQAYSRSGCLLLVTSGL